MVRWASCLILLVLSTCGCSRTGLEDLGIGDGFGAPGAGSGGPYGVGATGSGGRGNGGGRGEAAFGAIGSPGGTAGRGAGGGGAPSCTRDADGDGVFDVACGGLDCNDSNPSAHPGAVEICGDGADNDCNGVADCLDP